MIIWLRDYLTTSQYPFKVKIAASQNENSRHAVDLGMDVGEPDLRLSLTKDDIYYIFFLELKTKTGKLQESQKDWFADYEENFKASNTHYAVAYGYTQAQELIINWLASAYTPHITDTPCAL